MQREHGRSAGGRRWARRIALGCVGLIAVPIVAAGAVLGTGAYWRWGYDRHSAQVNGATCDAFKGAYRDGTLVGFDPGPGRKAAHRQPDSAQAITDRVAERRRKVLAAVGLSSLHPQLFVDRQDGFGVYDEAIVADRDAIGWTITLLFSDWKSPEMNKADLPYRLPAAAGEKLDQLIGSDCLYAEPQDVSRPRFPGDHLFHTCLDCGPSSVLIDTAGRHFGAIHYDGLYGMTGGVARLLWRDAQDRWGFHADPYQSPSSTGGAR